MERLRRSPRFRADQVRTRMVRNAVYLLASEGISAALGLAFWVLAARLTPDREAGIAAVFITSATLLASISTLGLNVALIRFLPERKGQETAMINQTAAISVVVAVGLAIAFAFGSGSWSPAVGFLSQNPTAFLLFVVFVAAWSAHFILDGTFVGLGAARSVLVRAGVWSVLKVSLLLPLVPSLGAPLGLFSAWGIGLLASNALALGWLLPRSVPGYSPLRRGNRGVIAPMLRYALASHVATIFGTLPGLVFPLLISIALPAENAVYFYVAWSAASILYLVPGSIFLSVFGEGSRSIARLGRTNRQGLLLTLALQAPAVAATLLLSNWVIRDVFRASYAPAVPALNVFAVASFPLAINLAYAAFLRVEQRLRAVVLLYGSTSTATLAFGFLLLPANGVLGAALAFAAVQFVAAVVSAREMIRRGALRDEPRPSPP